MHVHPIAPATTANRYSNTRGISATGTNLNIRRRSGDEEAEPTGDDGARRTQAPKGQMPEEQRQLFADKTVQLDWSDVLGEDTIAPMASAAASLLDAETFLASSSRDALRRVLTPISPDGGEVHCGYDEDGALEQVTLNHRGSVTMQTVVGDITYDAKGRRETVVYGHDDVHPRRGLAAPDSAAEVRASDSEAIQSLHVHYDPVGNITNIRYSAQQTA